VVGGEVTVAVDTTDAVGVEVEVTDDSPDGGTVFLSRLTMRLSLYVVEKSLASSQSQCVDCGEDSGMPGIEKDLTGVRFPRSPARNLIYSVGGTQAQFVQPRPNAQLLPLALQLSRAGKANSPTPDTADWVSEINCVTCHRPVLVVSVDHICRHLGNEVDRNKVNILCAPPVRGVGGFALPARAGVHL
jgi:hypothetical protein